MTTIEEMLTAAVTLHQAGKLPEAERIYSEILRGNPYHAGALHLLGVLAYQSGKGDVAIEYIGRALQYCPNLAEAHNNLGIVLKDMGKLPEAMASYQIALRIKPDYADAHSNLGIAFKEMGNLAEATASYQKALQINPNFAEGHNNLGNVLLANDQLDDAAARFQTALRLKPNYAETLTNYANVLQKQGKLHEALACYDQALLMKPGYAEAHWNKSLALLLSGNFHQGWAEYEKRWQSKHFHRRPFQQPLWDGSPLGGRTILLWAEQGLGDTLHFIRYAPLVQQRGGTVVMECQPPLLPLLAQCSGIDRLVAQNSPLPSFDLQVPLLSLPGIFRTDLATIPAQVSYLIADQPLVEHWREQLNSYQGFKIGIAWQGNPTHGGDRQRSMPLGQFAPLAQVPGVHLLSLQKGHGAEQLRAVADRFTVIDLGSRLDETNGAFMDTAAVMMNLDLIITADTATAHLAGALGVPVWVALPWIPDWRWLLERIDSPWYPSMRLFRQPQRGDWADVFNRMAQELKRNGVSQTARS